jgi:alkylation response protein AidB-like acyl-CoA dehydrogenase
MERRVARRQRPLAGPSGCPQRRYQVQFELTDDKSALKAMAADFLARECDLDFARRHDEAGTFPAGLYRKLGELGWLGIPFAEEYGGSEGDPLDEAIVLEELGRAMGPLASAFLISVLTCGKTIRDLGTPAQRARWLPPTITGEAMLAFALTEPQAGSDAAALRTRAVRADQGWVLNGQKIFCTGATLANQLLVMARTDTGNTATRGVISMFVVDTNLPGLTITPIPKLGLHPYPSCTIFFDDVQLPADALLGALHQGWPQLTSSLNRERLAISAMCTGMAQAALDVALRYIGERHQFGQPLAHFEAIQTHIADMAAAVAGARALSMRAAWLELSGMPSTRAASMAKIRASEAAVNTARLGMQVLGGYSYTMEYPMQRFLRDALIHPIAGGSNEIQRNIVAKDLELSLAAHGATEAAAEGAAAAPAPRTLTVERVTGQPWIPQLGDAMAILESAQRPGGTPEVLLSNLLRQFLTQAPGQAGGGNLSDRPTACLILPSWTGDRAQPVSLTCTYEEFGPCIHGVGTALATDCRADRAWLIATSPGADPADGYLLETVMPPPDGSGRPEGHRLQIDHPLHRFAGLSVPEKAVLRLIDSGQLAALRDLVLIGAAGIMVGFTDRLSDAILAAASRKAAASDDRWGAQADKHRAVGIATHRDTAWLHLRMALDTFGDAADRAMFAALALAEAAGGLQDAITDRRRLARLSGDDDALAAVCLASAQLDFWLDLAGGTGALTQAVFTSCAVPVRSHQNP